MTADSTSRAVPPGPPNSVGTRRLSTPVRRIASTASYCSTRSRSAAGSSRRNALRRPRAAGANRSSTVPPSGWSENGFARRQASRVTGHIDSRVVLSKLGDDLVREAVELGLDRLELQHEQLDPSIVIGLNAFGDLLVAADQAGEACRRWSRCVWCPTAPCTSGFSDRCRRRSRVGSRRPTSDCRWPSSAAASSSVSRAMTNADRPNRSGAPAHGRCAQILDDLDGIDEGAAVDEEDVRGSRPPMRGPARTRRRHRAAGDSVRRGPDQRGLAAAVTDRNLLTGPQLR